MVFKIWATSGLKFNLWRGEVCHLAARMFEFQPTRFPPPLPPPRDLLPTLISRFDLLYLILDEVNEAIDCKLAQHLVALYIEDNPETGGEDILPLDQLSAYINYGRSRVHPVITEEASHELVQSYVKLRSVGDDPHAAAPEKRITATTRQLESKIRLAEAHGRPHHPSQRLPHRHPAHLPVLETRKPPTAGIVQLPPPPRTLSPSRRHHLDTDTAISTHLTATTSTADTSMPQQQQQQQQQQQPERAAAASTTAITTADHHPRQQCHRRNNPTRLSNLPTVPPNCRHRPIPPNRPGPTSS
ncbi:MCM2/3/5 family-domain-containing protein [Lactarius hengduanensis]|nr:MCM2/3/5 family-domain-containing protein [Lactarius hengduanensis]